jgi:acyl-CoA reductase-like NAD-dependent aldehyde dehydrogenase
VARLPLPAAGNGAPCGRNTAKNFAVTTLELGGKSPVIVFDDANLDSALNGVIAGI